MHLLRFACALALAATCAAQDPRPPWPTFPGALVITHTEVLTMADPPRLSDRDVFVTDGVITAIEPAGTRAPDAGATVIDGRGATLLPGLFDMHVHVSDTEPDAQMVMYLAHGVTTVRSMHGTLRILALREKLARGAVPGPRFFTTGPTTSSERVDTPEKARALVAAQKAAGYDAIKMYGDGHDTMTRATYHALIEAAHAQGLPVIGHAPRNLPFEVVLAEGQDSIDHMEEIQYTATPILEVLRPLVRFQFGGASRTDAERVLAREDLDEALDAAAREVAEAVRATDLTVTPTLIAFTTILAHTTDDFPKLAQHPLLRCMSPLKRHAWAPENNGYRKAWEDDLEVMSRVLGCGLDAQKRLLRAFHAAGVPLLTGTDAPLCFVYPGWSLHRELALFVECGIPPLDALRAATIAPARALGIDDLVGTVEVGKQADLLLVRGDPSARIADVAAIAGVCSRGRWLDAAALAARMEELAASQDAVEGQMQKVQGPLERGDSAAVLAAWRALPGEHQVVSEFVEGRLNDLGYQKLTDGDIAGAVAVFAAIVEAFPESWNAWDSLGEGHMSNGDREEAIRCYERSLELWPGNSNGKEMLAKLRAQ
jgi:imidazolonepropionase-like amidohydrolase